MADWLKGIKKLSNERKTLLLGCLVVLFITVFVPRRNPLMSWDMTAKLGNIKGSVGFEAFEGRFPDTHDLIKKAKARPSFVMFYASLVWMVKEGKTCFCTIAS